MSSTSSSPSPDKPKLYKAVFQKSDAFDKHFIKGHVKVFLSINSNEYICAFCPCSTIANKSQHCAARFAADTPQTFLDHLKSCHAQSPEDLIWYPHACWPKTPASYTDPKIRRIAESFS